MEFLYFTAVFMFSYFIYVSCQYSSYLDDIELSTEERTRASVQLNSSKFSDVVNTTGFVDKTFLLKTMFKDDHRTLLITAPHRFGKSTNLNMIKSFFSIAVDKNGKVLEKNSTEQYKYFSKLVIHNYTRFFYVHFCSVAVVSLDLDAKRRIVSYNDAYSILIDRIHLSYLEHRYLISTVKLSKSDRDVCRVWCHKNSYKRLNNDQVKEGLVRLASYLHVYYGWPVFVLIDEFDSLIRQSMFTVSKPDLRKIIDLIIDYISVLCQTTKHVRLCVITGVSYIAGGGFSNISNIAYFRFLESHKLNRYYGFLEEEGDSILKIPGFDFDVETMKEARLWYNGYMCRDGLLIGSPYSLLNFVAEGNIRNYWAEFGNVDDLRVFFKHQSILNITQELLSFTYCPVQVYRNFTIEDLLALKDIYSEKEVIADRNLVVSYLLDTGYVTFSGNQQFSDSPHLKVANLEIVDLLFQELIAAYRARDPDLVPKVLSEIQEKARNNMDCVKFLKFVREFYEPIKNDFRKQMGFSDVYNVYIKYNITLF